MKKETAKLYLKTHNKTGMKYLGITTGDPINSYKGSGAEWKKHIKEHGKHDVTTEILYEEPLPVGNKTTNKFKQICKEYSDLFNVVKNKNFANLKPEDGTFGALGEPYKPYNYKGENKIIEYDEKVSDVYKDDSLSKASVELEDYHYSTNFLENEVSFNEFKCVITKVFLGLTAREERVLRMRFGIGLKKDYTLEEIGQHFSLTRDRIRQIEAKGLRKLKHPFFSRKLRPFLEDLKTGEFSLNAS